MWSIDTRAYKIKQEDPSLCCYCSVGITHSRAVSVAIQEVTQKSEFFIFSLHWHSAYELVVCVVWASVYANLISLSAFCLITSILSKQ